MLWIICRIYRDWDGHCAEGLAACDDFINKCGNCDDLDSGRRIREGFYNACHADVTVITRPPGGRVTIDGGSSKPEPVEAHLLEGSHEFAAELAGHEPASRRQAIPGGKRVQVELVLPPVIPELASSPSNEGGDPPVDPPCGGLAWGGIAAGTVGLVLGTYFLVELLSVQKEIRDYGNCDGLCTGPTADDLEQDQTIAGTLSGVGFGLLVVGGGTAAYCFHQDRQKTIRQPKSSVTPAVGIDTLGLRIRF